MEKNNRWLFVCDKLSTLLVSYFKENDTFYVIISFSIICRHLVISVQEIP